MALTPEQLAMRLSGVASSDIPAIADLFPKTWKTRRGPDDVLAEKLGTAAPFEGNGRTRKGERLEPYIAQWWAEENNRKVIRNEGTHRHPEIEWALATPDYVTADEASELVECKLVSPWVAKSWEPEPPHYTLAQVQWQLGVLGKKRAYVAAFLEGSEHLVRSYPVEFDPAVFQQLVVIASRFWQRVLDARAV